MHVLRTKGMELCFVRVECCIIAALNQNVKVQVAPSVVDFLLLGLWSSTFRAERIRPTQVITAIPTIMSRPTVTLRRSSLGCGQ